MSHNTSGHQTYNQFFARHARPGRRPVAGLCDDAVVVAPADAVFIGAWPVAGDASIPVDEPALDVKGLRWSIHQLLDGSGYAGRFAGRAEVEGDLAPLRGLVGRLRIFRDKHLDNADWGRRA